MAEAEDELADLRKDLEGVVKQIDAHHREEDVRQERRQGNGPWDGTGSGYGGCGGGGGGQFGRGWGQG